MARTSNKRAAVFTIVRDDPVWLRIWLRHYSQWFAANDIYILDHQSQPEPVLQEIGQRVRVLPVFNDVYYPLQWLVDTVSAFQRYLLQSYDSVLYTDVDELVFTRPGGAYRDLAHYIASMTAAYSVCTGYEVVHKHDEEPPIDFDAVPLLANRHWWYRTLTYSKPLLARQPLTWSKGFHKSQQTMGQYADEELLLVHLHKIDYGYKVARASARAAYQFTADPGDVRCVLQQRYSTGADLLTWWYQHIDWFPDFSHPQELVEIPEAVRAVI